MSENDLAMNGGRAASGAPTLVLGVNSMDHQESARIFAAEKYLLNELSTVQRDEFEEHFFSCPECADEVRAAFAFADNARAVLAEQSRSVPRPLHMVANQKIAAPALKSSREGTNWFGGWLRPAVGLPIAASVVLLAVTAYQAVLVIPALRQEVAEATAPRALPSTVLRPISRGDDPVIEVRKEDRFLHLVLDINAPQTSSQYLCELRSDSGAPIFTVPVSAPAPGASLNLLLPASALSAGRYTLIVRSRAEGLNNQTGAELDRYSFVLQRK